jgi:hypothetical protein
MPYTVNDFARRAVIWLAILAAVTGCSGSSTGPQTISKSGRYVVVWTRSAAVCSPVALPAPAEADTTQYVRVSQSMLTLQSTLDARDDDSTISFAAVAGTGSNPTLAVAGPVAASTDVALLTRSATQMEGPRAGGHSFYVAESGVDSTRFIHLVETPPGRSVEISFTGTGSGTSTFRDGGASGPIFTTCAFSETVTGSKVSG